MRILSVASEFFPLIKTGGLADVAGALPSALAPLGIEMRPLLPAYRSVLETTGEGREVAAWADLMGMPARLLELDHAGSALYLLDAPGFFDRPGNPYTGPDGADWPDNALRFAALARAAAEIGLGRLAGWHPDIVHGHDWQAGLAPAYLRLSSDPQAPRTVMTVHNLAFQGQCSPTLLGPLGLPAAAFTVDGLEYYGTIGFLKAGLFYADALTTVSPTYALEIQTPETGMGLDGLLRARSVDLVGIVNGIDRVIWNPATDPHLAARYDAADLTGKAANKKALQARMGLDVAPEVLLACVVSRLTAQKGMDLLLEVLPGFVAGGGQLALLGSGDPWLEAAFRTAAAAHPGRIACIFGYDEPLSHLMQGGSDVILVPSRFEPCGLTQLYGLAYGTLPVVARTGGLADTVIDANHAALGVSVATGFQFAPVTATGLHNALARTLRLFAEADRWRTMRLAAMRQPVGWSESAALYAALYRHLTA